MSPDNVVTMAAEMMWMAFLVSLPLLVTALIIGVGVSILQTVTGVQEMTLTFVPKLAAVLAALAISLPWMQTLLVEYTKRILLGIGGGM